MKRTIFEIKISQNTMGDVKGEVDMRGVSYEACQCYKIPFPTREQLLGSGDIQSLADLGNSFKMVRDMKIFPFNNKVVLQFAVVAALPALPLVLLVIPIEEIMKLLAGALL